MLPKVLYRVTIKGADRMRYAERGGHEAMNNPADFGSRVALTDK